MIRVYIVKCMHFLTSEIKASNSVCELHTCVLFYTEGLVRFVNTNKNKRVFGKYVYLPRITHESSKAYFQWGPV
jgi:hypothetical protein